MLVRDGDLAQIGHLYRMLNRAFHGQVHALARSELIDDAASGMWDRCDFYLKTHRRNLFADRACTSDGEHAAIDAALPAKNPARGRALGAEASGAGQGRAGP